MKKIMVNIFFCFVFVISATASFSENSSILIIKDYSQIIDFSKVKVVRIEKGDNIEFARLEYDDSKWKIISLPSDWTKIFPSWIDVCWYRIHVKFPPMLPPHSLGIQLGVINDVDELYFNGVRIGASGNFPPNRQSCYDKIRMYEIPTILIRPGVKNVFALRVASLFPSPAGPYTGEFYIGPFVQLHRNLLTREFFTMFFVVIYLAVGMYFGIIYFLHDSEKYNLFFSLATLSSALYFFFRTQIKYLVSDNFLLMKKIEYMILFLIFSLFFEFITFYASRRHTIIHYLFHVITSICIGIVFVSDSPLVWNAILKNVVQPTWILPVTYCFYVTIISLKNHKEYYFILIAFIILSITIVNDVLVNRHIYEFMSLSPYAYLLLILGISYIMHKRFVELKNRIKETFNPAITPIRNKKRIPPETEEKLKKALAIIEEKYKDEITREFLADEVGMNADYFGKIFKQYTGKKLSEYINEVRVRRAQKMLADPENSISNIAFAVGFESLPTFYRVFMKYTGQTPQAYRKKFLDSAKNM